MRSIGKIRTKKLEKMVMDEIQKNKQPYSYHIDYAQVKQTVWDNIPDEWFDIWESAYNEIKNIIQNTIINSI